MIASMGASSNGDAVSDMDPAVGTSLIDEMQGVLAHIPESISLYKTELEKLLTAFTKSQESEQRLLVRTKEILSEIHSSHEAMLHDQEEENEVVAQKKKTKLELDAVHQQIVASQQMEADKQQKLNDLRSNLALLQEDLSKMSATGNAATGEIVLNEEQELHIASMKRQRAEYARDVETKATTLQDLRRETSNLYALLQEEETANAQLEERQARVSGLIRDKQQLTETEARRKATLERELKTHKQTLERLVSDVATKDALKLENDASMRRKDVAMRESKQTMEKYLKQYDALFRTTHSLTEAMQTQWHKNVELHKENARVEHELHTRAQAVESVTRDANKLEKLNELAREQIADIDAKRAACDAEREQTKSALDDLVNGALESATKTRELLARKLDEMLRERDVLNKMLVKATDRTKATFDLMKIKANTEKNLTNEINGMQTHVKRQRATLQMLVSDRERYEREAAVATHKFTTALEEAKLQDLQVVSLQQKIVESESRLKQQQNLYEAVRADRNVYSKQLVESQDAIATMKRTFKVMNHQIEQLKEEITAKDHALVKEHFDHHKVDKEKEILKNELLRIKKQIQSSEQISANQELEVAKLAKIIQDADDETQRQRKELRSVVHDRDTLRQQLIQRTDELHILYEKIKIQRSTLRKGHDQFDAKCRDVADLQQRMQRLALEQQSSHDQLAHEGALKAELLLLENELLEEKAKIRALSDELDHPLNVHRWRKLEGSDPKRFEMIRKLQIVQKKLIRKYDETAVKDLLILEKEKLYVELKTILARQPGAEVAEQLAVYKETLKAKQSQMRRMDDELAMYKLQVNEYRRDMEQLEAEKQRLQRTWLDAQLKRSVSANSSSNISNNQFASSGVSYAGNGGQEYTDSDPTEQ